jgi:hypothetical protein
VVVAVVAVRAVKVAVDEEVDVVAVRHQVMPAALAVDVLGVMSLAVVLGSAARRVLVVYRDRVLVDVVAVRMVQVPVVQVVDVVFMHHSDVPAAGTVLVLVVGVDRVVAHAKKSRNGDARGPSRRE